MSKKQESCIGSLSSTILELQNIKPSCKILRFWCWDILSLPSATRQNASCKEVCLQLAASILHVLHPGNVDEIRVKQLATKRKSITAWIAVGRIIAATTLRWSAAWRRGAFCTVSSTNGVSWVRRVWPAMPGKATRERPFFHKTEFFTIWKSAAFTNDHLKAMPWNLTTCFMSLEKKPFHNMASYLEGEVLSTTVFWQTWVGIYIYRYSYMMYGNVSK